MAPSAAATAGPHAGVCRKWVLVATTTQSMSDASRPALAIASRPASVAIEAVDSSRAANRRVLMPVRE